MGKLVTCGWALGTGRVQYQAMPIPIPLLSLAVWCGNGQVIGRVKRFMYRLMDRWIL